MAVSLDTPTALNIVAQGQCRRHATLGHKSTENRTLKGNAVKDNYQAFLGFKVAEVAQTSERCPVNPEFYANPATETLHGVARKGSTIAAVCATISG